MTPPTLIASLKQSLLVDFGKKLEGFGYKGRPAGQSFHRRTDDTVEWVHVSFIPHVTDVHLTVNFAVRINAIEELVNLYDTKRDAASKRTSTTVGSELGNLAYGQPKRWTLSASASEQPSVVVKSVIDSVEQIGLPFMKRYSILSNVRKALESNERDLRILCPFLGPRLMRAIAAVYLQDGHLDPVQCNSYILSLEQANDLQLQDFRSLAEGLTARAAQM